MEVSGLTAPPAGTRRDAPPAHLRGWPPGDTAPYVIDARLGKRITGIGYYTLNLAQALGAAAPGQIRALCWLKHRRAFRSSGLDPWVAFPDRLPWRRELPPARVIHGTNFHAPEHPSAARVATIHDLGYLRFPDCYPPGMPERLDAIIRDSLPQTSLFICNSFSTAEDFATTYGVPEERCRVIHLGVSPEYFAEVSPEQLAGTRRRFGIESPYLLHVGSILPRKGIPTLLRAFEMISEEEAGLSLVLAGTKSRRWASDWPVVQRWLSDHPNVCKRVKVLPYLPGSTVSSVYRGAAAVVSATRWEGFGLTVLEGMASGVPVVSSRIGAIPEVGGEVVYYGVPDQPETYASAIREALRDSGGNARRRAGIELARAFTWEKAARRTIAAYEDASS